MYVGVTVRKMDLLSGATGCLIMCIGHGDCVEDRCTDPPCVYDLVISREVLVRSDCEEDRCTAPSCAVLLWTRSSWPISVNFLVLSVLYRRCTRSCPYRW